MIYLLLSRKNKCIFYNQKKEELYYYSGQTNSNLKYPPGFMVALLLFIPLIFISIFCGLNYRKWIICDVAYLLCVLISRYLGEKNMKKYVNSSTVVALNSVISEQASEMLHTIYYGEKTVYPYGDRAKTLYVLISLLLIGNIIAYNPFMAFLLIISIEVFAFTCLPLYLNKKAIKRVISILETKINSLDNNITQGSV